MLWIIAAVIFVAACFIVSLCVNRSEPDPTDKFGPADFKRWRDHDDDPYINPEHVHGHGHNQTTTPNSEDEGDTHQ